MKLNAKKDLTRWNRAGLSQFRYIDGNAISYLETLRLELLQQFNATPQHQWSELATRLPELPDEDTQQRNQRLSSQYYDERRDYAWEILRSFSRSAHILGEYINAYANEAYLPTATEWDNVRRLVAMLDYRPSPPASAATYIALLLKKSQSGMIEAGFALKNKPGKGESTVIFETRQNLQGSAAINQLRLHQWNINDAVFQTSANSITFPLAADIKGLHKGMTGVLTNSIKGIPVRVLNIQQNAELDTQLTLQFLNSDRPDNDFKYHNTRLYLDPKFIESPHPRGPNSLVTDSDLPVTSESIIFVRNGDWSAHRINAHEFRKLSLSGTLPELSKGDNIYRAIALHGQTHKKLNAGKIYILPADFDPDHAFFINESLQKVSTTFIDKVIDETDGRIKSPHSTIKGTPLRYVEDNNFGAVIYMPGTPFSARVEQAPLTELSFSGKKTALREDQWVLIKAADGTLRCDRITGIDQQKDQFNLRLSADASSVNLQQLSADFAITARLKQHDNNQHQAWSSSSTDAITVIEIQADAALTALHIGQKLIVSSDSISHALTLQEIIPSSDKITLHLSPPFHLDTRSGAMTRYNSVIYGNVVQATHGESQPEKIIGNGDASLTNQQFELPSDNIAWIADSAFNAGVRADLIVKVGQRVWKQVADLSLSTAEDHHYSVKIDQDNRLFICFGDGRQARRLPTGIDNVRVVYRNGQGVEGNLKPGSLAKIARPHVLVEDFVAPIASSGGAGKESAESMRDTAPATVLSLSRAVSIDDFTHLASHHSMVWQARAFEKMPDRPSRPLIEVVIVQAGGATFSAGSDSATLIKNFLIEHAVPETPVSVVSYKPLLMQLELSIMVDEAAYDKKQVEAAVKAHIENAFTIQQRRLGQALYRSEVIALLEQVEGVENGHCEILNANYSTLGAASRPRMQQASDGMTRKVSIKPDQLIYLDSTAYPLQISCRSYEI